MNRRNVLKSIPALIGATFIPSLVETDFAKAVRIAENSKGSAAKRLAGFAENSELTLFGRAVNFGDSRSSFDDPLYPDLSFYIQEGSRTISRVSFSVKHLVLKRVPVFSRAVENLCSQFIQNGRLPNRLGEPISFKFDSRARPFVTANFLKNIETKFSHS